MDRGERLPDEARQGVDLTVEEFATLLSHAALLDAACDSRTRLRELKRSPSWRLTAPFREARRVATRLASVLAPAWAERREHRLLETKRRLRDRIVRRYAERASAHSARALVFGADAPAPVAEILLDRLAAEPGPHAIALHAEGAGELARTLDHLQARGMLGRLPLIVTLSDRGLAGDARLHGLDNAMIVRCADRGRDALPFIALLANGLLDRFDFVCKLHTDRARLPPAAGRRQRAILEQLLAGPGTLRLLAELDDPDAGTAPIGMVGPACCHAADGGDGWRDFRLDWLARRLGAAAAGGPGHFAGAMFWVRPRLLMPALRICATDAAFEENAAGASGSFAEVMERAFPLAILAAGAAIATIDSAGAVEIRSSDARQGRDRA